MQLRFNCLGTEFTVISLPVFYCYRVSPSSSSHNFTSLMKGVTSHVWQRTSWSRFGQDGSWDREGVFEEDYQKFFGALPPNCKASFIARHKSSCWRPIPSWHFVWNFFFFILLAPSLVSFSCYYFAAGVTGSCKRIRDTFIPSVSFIHEICI
jgi:hypothetical protein